MLPMPEAVFVRAADIYRKLRKQGITIRKTNDCIIAATALEHQCQVAAQGQGLRANGKTLPLEGRQTLTPGSLCLRRKAT